MAGGWAEVAGPGAGHVCGGDDWGDAAEFSLMIASYFMQINMVDPPTSKPDPITTNLCNF